MLELNDKLQVVARISLVHGREFQAEMLPDFGKFFFRIRLQKAQVVDPENSGLRARKRLRRTVGRGRELMPEKRGHRQDLERFAFRQGDEPGPGEAAFDVLRGAAVVLEQGTGRRPVGGRLLDHFERRTFAELRRGSLQQIILLRDQPLADRPRLARCELETQPFTNEKLESLATHRKIACSRRFLSLNRPRKIFERSHRRTQKRFRAGRMRGDPDQLGLKTLQKFHAARAGFDGERGPERHGLPDAFRTRHEEIRKLRQPGLDRRQRANELFACAHHQIKNRVHRGVHVLLRIRSPTLQIPREEDFRAQLRQKPAAIQPTIAGKGAFRELFDPPQRLLEKFLIPAMDDRGICAEKRLTFLESPPAPLLRKNFARASDPVFSNSVQGLHR